MHADPTAPAAGPTPPDLRARFRGALLGVAVGDALGAPFEGAQVVHRRDLDRVTDAPGPLRYTDDTHMTIGMAQSLVERRGFDGAHMAALLARNFAAEPWRGYAAGPPQVFRRLEAGVPWDEAGRTLFGGAGSFGNGGAMRVAPAALLAWQDLERVAWLARQTAGITHGHELGQEGAVLQACAVALLLQQSPGAPLDTRAFLDALRHRVRHPLYAERLDRIAAMPPGAGREAVAAGLGNGIEALAAVPAAICTFLGHAESFREAVARAIELGGDTDTIGAMTGALAGAYLGEEAIPAPWRERVEGGGLLTELSDALLALAIGQT